MNLSNYYWSFKSVLTPRFCDEVIKHALMQKEEILDNRAQIYEDVFEGD